MDGHNFTTTNHRTGEEYSDSTVSIPGLPDQDQPGPTSDMVELLLQSGYEVTGFGTFNGRQTTVLRSQPASFSQYELTPVEDGNYRSPVVYDLGADRYVTEMHIDSERGMVLRSLRYAIDSEGKETLIESFEWLAVQDIR